MLPSVTLPAPLARVMTDYEKAWGAQDAAGLAALFTEDAIYDLNDPSATLLRACAWAIWRSVGPGLSAATTGFLTIDPTIAAHLPVVMTDLSTAILSISAVMLTAPALRTQRGFDYLAASVFLGLALDSIDHEDRDRY